MSYYEEMNKELEKECARKTLEINRLVEERRQAWNEIRELKDQIGETKITLDQYWQDYQREAAEVKRLKELLGEINENKHVPSK